MKLRIELRKLIIIFVIGFCVYSTIEVVFNAIEGTMIGYKGASYWTLKGASTIYTGVLGGIILIILGKINEIGWCKHHCCMLALAFMSAIIVLAAEFLLGFLLNIQLKLNLWSYEGRFGNIMGQICLPYGFYWFLLAPLAFWLDDLLRWVFYKVGFLKEHRRVYSLLWLYRQLLSIKPPHWGGTTTYAKKESIRLEML